MLEVVFLSGDRVVSSTSLNLMLPEVKDYARKRFPVAQQRHGVDAVEVRHEEGVLFRHPAEPTS